MADGESQATIRPLADGDRSQWEMLWTAYLAFYHTTLTPEVFDAQWARLRAGGTFFARVAELDGQLVGLVHVLLHDHGWRLERVCYLQDLFTAPEARGRGVGAALIRAAYDEADARGAPNLYWLTEVGNAQARVLYDRIGEYTPFVRYRRPL